MKKRKAYRPKPVLLTEADFAAEEWRPVLGYEGRYSVSSLGRVRSEPRTCPGKLGSTRTLPGVLRTPTADSSGYLHVCLGNGHGNRSFEVARLVAEAFLGPKPPGMQVCHNDGNRINNVVRNLRYDTREGNAADRLLHGTHCRGERSCRAKLTRQQVDLIRADVRSCRRLAKLFSVHHSTISSVRRGKSWL